MTRVRNYRKVMCLVLTTLLLCNLTGCMLLPKEKEDRRVTFVEADELEQYDFISPKKMDLKKILEIPCVYKQLQEESLSFKVGNKKIESINVSPDDKVSKGTLLASLEIGNLKNDIKELEQSINQAKESVNQLKNKATYEKQYIELDYKYNKITKTEKKLKITSIEDNLKTELAAKKDQIYILELRLKKLEETLEGSLIYAPIDGRISFVSKNALKKPSEEGVTIIKMTNPDKCAFEIYVTEDSEYLKEGETYLVNVLGTKHEGVLMPRERKDQSYIYLQVKDAPSSFEVGESGLIEYQVERNENALVVPTNVVHMGEGFYFVYVVNEDNVKVIQKVKIGITTDEYVEILDGIKEGDLVLNE